MGARNSRRMFMMIDDDDDSVSRIEDTSEDSDDSIESDSDPEEQSFVDMLHSLINRAQLPLETNDRDFHPDIRMPKIKYKLDTSILDKSEFSLLTKKACGLLEPKRRFSKTNNVSALIRNRESGLYKEENFSKATRCKISNQYLPNEMVGTLENGSAKIFCGIFSGDGNTFLTASQDRNIKLYDVKSSSYELYKTIRARDVGWSIIDVAFSPDGSNFVYSTWSSSLHMCPVRGSSDHQEPLSLVNTSRRFCVFSVTYSSDGKELVCGTNDGCLYIYNMEVQSRILRIPAHTSDINRVLFADNSSQIIYSGSDDGLVKVWDRRTLDDRHVQPVGQLAGHMDGITYIDSKGDGRHLISNSKDQTIKLWDVRCFSNEKTVTKALCAVKNPPWDYRGQGVPKGFCQANRLDGDTSIMTYKGHVVAKTLIRARFSPAETTGQRYIYTGCGTGRVLIFDALTGKPVKQLKMHSTCVRDVSWHPTRNEILSSSWDGTVGRWTYCKTNSVDKTKDSFSAKPLRRSARLAAQRQVREQAN
ncbi:DDB1- and CUL4-associated factor 11 isoform X2 [Sitophilus oryzae]|uniref:DDB1- and CUL4-associated factor 11 isoform X2 n=1 Tax=Sitophilus oryzae TaxID=7048 RepID=A0A6J2YQ19_SITOR|nr:DDB1- and CUL4-associated factor 11 isoform X2 [Sitophilus oryzae]